MPDNADDPPGEAAEEKKNPAAPYHVAAVLARMLERGEPVPVAPLPGGWGAKAREPAPYAGELTPPVLGDRAVWGTLGGILGGWWADTLAVLVGHTGRGKSSLAVQIAEQAAHDGAPVLYASMEMGGDELIARLIALRGTKAASWSALKRGAYPAAAVAEAGARLVADAPHLYLWAPPSKDRTPDRLAVMARAVAAAAGGRPPLVILDYVQRLAGGGADDRRGAVSDLSGALRDLSRPALGWPGAAVLALSSTSRAGYPNFATVEALSMAADLEGSGKESGELEYDAPILLCMTSDKPEDGAGEPSKGRLALVRVVKNREGSTGRASMLFHAARGRFEETEAPPKPEKAASSKASPEEQARKAEDRREESLRKALVDARAKREKALLKAGDDKANKDRANLVYEVEMKAAHDKWGAPLTYTGPDDG